MQFEELWEEVQKQNILSQVAIDSVPSILSDKAKKLLQAMGPHEVCAIIKDSINKIDEGSIEPLNSIVLQKIYDWMHIDVSVVEK